MTHSGHSRCDEHIEPEVELVALVRRLRVQDQRLLNVLLRNERIAAHGAIPGGLFDGAVVGVVGQKDFAALASTFGFDYVHAPAPAFAVATALALECSVVLRQQPAFWGEIVVVRVQELHLFEICCK